jgi:hypothetical protein
LQPVFAFRRIRSVRLVPMFIRFRCRRY